MGPGGHAPHCAERSVAALYRESLGGNGSFPYEFFSPIDPSLRRIVCSNGSDRDQRRCLGGMMSKAFLPDSPATDGAGGALTRTRSHLTSSLGALRWRLGSLRWRSALGELTTSSRTPHHFSREPTPGRQRPHTESTESPLKSSETTYHLVREHTPRWPRPRTTSPETRVAVAAEGSPSQPELQLRSSETSLTTPAS
jgi:hypothetical protein